MLVMCCMGEGQKMIVNTAPRPRLWNTAVKTTCFKDVWRPRSRRPTSYNGKDGQTSPCLVFVVVLGSCSARCPTWSCLQRALRNFVALHDPCDVLRIFFFEFLNWMHCSKSMLHFRFIAKMVTLVSLKSKQIMPFFFEKEIQATDRNKTFG